MKIGIIGAGYVGRAIGKLAVRSGHQVMLSNSRGPQTLFSLIYGVGCEVGTIEEAAAFGDIVVVAIPLAAYRSIPAGPLAGKVVIDTDNYYWERDGRIAELDAGETTTSELLARHLPRSRIVKAFNTVFAAVLAARAEGQPVSVPVFVAGDEGDAVDTVVALVEAFGLKAVRAGGLRNARYLEPMTEQLIQLGYGLGMGDRIGFGIVTAA